MRIVCISDTHSLHKIMDDINPLPQGDILIHAGDCTNVGKPHEVKEFVEWFMNIKGFDSKIFIAGNHDWAFQKVNEPHHSGDYDWFHNLMNDENLSQSDVTYLEDTNFTIEESGGKLIFKYGATTIASMDSTGLITSSANIVSNGTP